MKRNWLVQQRKQKELTQEELAERCGYTNKTISMIELGQRNPSIDIAFKLASILDFDIDMFADENLEKGKRRGVG